MYTTFLFYAGLILTGVAVHRRFPDVKPLNEIADALITLAEVPARLAYEKFQTPKEDKPSKAAKQAA